MSIIKRLWTRSERFAELLDGVDDPTGEHLFSLAKRVDKLERAVKQLESQRHLGSGGGGIQQ